MCSSDLTKWCAQPFPPIFGLFAIFDHNFAKIVAPPSNEYENYVMYLKEQSPVKKTLKTAKCLFKLCTPRTHGAPDSERDRQKTNSDKHHIFAPTAGTRSMIFPKLCMVIEDVETIK